MSPADLVQAAKANGMSAVGPTDHDLLTGIIEFVTDCKEAIILPHTLPDILLSVLQAGFLMNLGG